MTFTKEGVVMKNKKIVIIIGGAFLLIILLVAYVYRPLTLNNISNKPNFKGVVTEVYENSMMVSVNADEDESKSSDLMIVSLDVKIKDSMTDFEVGNKVKVYYDGNIAESYPAQINTVYAVLLVDE